MPTVHRSRPRLSFRMENQRTFVFEIVRDLRLGVLYCTGENPLDREWDEYLAAIEPLLESPNGYRALVLASSGHPTRSQQARLHKLLGTQRPLVAVISDAVVTRFVCSVLALFNSKLQCFSIHQRHAAFHHLHLARAEVERVNACIARLEAQLAAPPRRAVNG